jgi:predicted phosphohydrolase
MKVQIYSDIHLEYYSKFPQIEPLAKILILSGDIGYIGSEIYKEFIKYVSKNWVKVFIVLGNHEYYHDSKPYSLLNKEFKKYLTNFNNVILLDKEIFLLDDTLIVGCTFWSNIDHRVENYINDFKHIKMFDKNNNLVNLTIEEYQTLHRQDKHFLSNCFVEGFIESFQNIIIITHYPLTQHNTSHPKYNKDPLWMKNYFSNDIDFNQFINVNDKNIVCISGHTHYSFDFVKNNIRFISNQFGYKNELKQSNLKTDGVFDLFY